MKRQHFHITSTLGHDILKNAWNSANRAIEGMFSLRSSRYAVAKALAVENGADYTLTASESVKEGF